MNWKVTNLCVPTYMSHCRTLYWLLLADLQKIKRRRQSMQALEQQNAVFFFDKGSNLAKRKTFSKIRQLSKDCLIGKMHATDKAVLLILRNQPRQKVRPVMSEWSRKSQTDAGGRAFLDNFRPPSLPFASRSVSRRHTIKGGSMSVRSIGASIDAIG